MATANNTRRRTTRTKRDNKGAGNRPSPSRYQYPKDIYVPAYTLAMYPPRLADFECKHGKLATDVNVKCSCFDEPADEHDSWREDIYGTETETT